MIIRKTTCKARDDIFGNSGGEQVISPEVIDGLLYSLPNQITRPMTIVPIKYRQVARVAILSSERVYRGFSFHNACYRLTPTNWRPVLELAKPDYLLVEPGIYGSNHSWPLACFKPEFPKCLRQMAQSARRYKIPSFFWFTLDKDFAARFCEAMHAFDVVGCADDECMSYLIKQGINAVPMPWAFAPEQFNPLRNVGNYGYNPMLIFDGIARMMRFPEVREVLQKIGEHTDTGKDLYIIDSGMFVPKYNIDRFGSKILKNCVAGCVSQTCVQEIYKTATAYLALPDSAQKFPPAQQWRALEAAACQLPVFYIGKKNFPFLDTFSEKFSTAKEFCNRYEALKTSAIERDITAHLAWRAAHSSHTFAHRMASIHSLLGLGCEAFSLPLVSVVVPSMRPECIDHIVETYASQTWDPKELVYVFNGAQENIPDIPIKDNIKIIQVPFEYGLGMMVNAGFCNAAGEYIFKIDDDDLYGSHYISDRMIFLCEFNVQIISHARFFVKFGESDISYLIGGNTSEDDNTVFNLGNTQYVMGKFPSSIGIQRNYAQTVACQEQAYASEDVSLLLRGITFKPFANYIKTDSFNFCVVRHDISQHSWNISPEELLGMNNAGEFKLPQVFI